MATNINLSSSETIEKRTLTGKSALVASILLLALVFGTYFALVFMKGRYASQTSEISSQIAAEQDKLSGTGFSDVLDFSSRLNLIDKALDDHAYWDNFLLKMSSYVIPEVRFTKLSGKKDSSGAGLIDISGVAANLDALSRELILLKSFPGLDSLEFKNASEGSGQNGQQNGIAFEASAKVSKSDFQK